MMVRTAVSKGCVVTTVEAAFACRLGDTLIDDIECVFPFREKRVAIHCFFADKELVF